jgi:hypothetical protein
MVPPKFSTVDSFSVAPPSISSPRSPAHHRTVAEAYCDQRAIPAAGFERALLAETLHPAARRVRLFLALIPGYFEPDLRFISYVGRLRRLEDLRYEEIDFNQDRANRGFLRGQLHLRVSARRVRQVVRQTLGEPDEDPNPL